MQMWIWDNIEMSLVLEWATVTSVLNFIERPI